MSKIIELIIFYMINVSIYYIYINSIKCNNIKCLKLIKQKLKYINENIINHITVNIYKVLIVILLSVTTIIMIFKSYIYAYIFYIMYIYTIYVVANRLMIKHKEKLISEIPMFFMSIKNNFKITNDIIKSLCNTNKKLEISKYFKNIEYEIETGKTIEVILNQVQASLAIDELNTFFIIIINCYKYGGDYKKIIENEEKVIVKNRKNKNEFIKKEKEIDMVIILFILGNIFLVINNYFLNVNKINNVEKIIYYIDIISIYILLINFKIKKEM